jgi:hypothetical protein
MNPDNCKTIDDIRQFCQENPDHRVALSWSEMLLDMDEFGEDYSIHHFLAELDELLTRHKF